MIKSNYNESNYITNDKLLEIRPVLSPNNIEKFYDILYNFNKTEDILDMIKNVFMMLYVNPQATREHISESLGISKTFTDRSMATVLRLIYEIENGIEISDSDYIPNNQIITVREPRPYRYTDQNGKQWWCLNEFFGLT